MVFSTDSDRAREVGTLYLQLASCDCEGVPRKKLRPRRSWARRAARDDIGTGGYMITSGAYDESYLLSTSQAICASGAIKTLYLTFTVQQDASHRYNQSVVHQNR